MRKSLQRSRRLGSELKTVHRNRQKALGTEAAAVTPYAIDVPASQTYYRDVFVAEGNVVRQPIRIGKLDHSRSTLEARRTSRYSFRPQIATAVIPIATLVPEPYELTKDIPAVLQPADDGFIATFFDANISTSGDTEEEAVSNLRSLIVDIFEYLESEPMKALGPEPRRQLAVLRAFIRRA